MISARDPGELPSRKLKTSAASGHFHSALPELSQSEHSPHKVLHATHQNRRAKNTKVSTTDYAKQCNTHETTSFSSCPVKNPLPALLRSVQRQHASHSTSSSCPTRLLKDNGYNFASRPNTRYEHALCLPGADDVPHLVKDDAFERSLLFHAGDVIHVEGHLSFVGDAAAVGPDAPRAGEAKGSRRAVDGLQSRADAELAGGATVAVGTGAGDMGQDFSPPGQTATVGGSLGLVKCHAPDRRRSTKTGQGYCSTWVDKSTKIADPPTSDHVSTHRKKIKKHWVQRTCWLRSGTRPYESWSMFRGSPR